MHIPTSNRPPPKKQVGGGGVFGILLSLFAVVILSGAYFPHIWTCSRRE